MEATLDNFAVLGLSQYESRAYVALAGLTEATGPKISRLSGVPMSKIYEVLLRLSKRGFVLMSPDSKPKRYKAIDPMVALDSHADMMKSKIDGAKGSIVTILNKKLPEERDKSIWIVRGEGTVESLISSLLNKADKGVVWHYANERQRSIQKRLEELAKKGVEISTKPSEIRTNIINIDGREMVVFSDKKEALWIRDPKYCKVRVG